MYLINLQSKESIFEQIKKQIDRYVKLGVLKPNDKLPSVRSLANDLGINPNTVARAYSELEKEGIIYTLNKKGVFVGKQTNDDSLYKQALIALESYRKDGLSKSQAEEIFKKVYKEVKKC